MDKFQCRNKKKILEDQLRTFEGNLRFFNLKLLTTPKPTKADIINLSDTKGVTITTKIGTNFYFRNNN